MSWGGTRLMGVNGGLGLAGVRGLGASDQPAPLPGASILASTGYDPQKLIFSASGALDQAWGQLSQASAAGLSDEQIRIHQLSIQRIQDQLSQLNDDASSIKDASTLNAYNQRAQSLVMEANKELSAVVKLNQQSIVGGTYTGLYWGLGIAAAVATAGFLVWRTKKRHRG